MASLHRKRTETTTIPPRLCWNYTKLVQLNWFYPAHPVWNEPTDMSGKRQHTHPAHIPDSAQCPMVPRNAPAWLGMQQTNGNPKGAVITSIRSLCTAWPFTSLWASVPLGGYWHPPAVQWEHAGETHGNNQETGNTHTKTRHTRWQSYLLLDKGGPGWPYVTRDKLGRAQKGWDFLWSPTYRQWKSSHGVCCDVSRDALVNVQIFS